MSEEVTDIGWFTERAREFEQMDRDQLLHEARRWAFDYQQAKVAEIRSAAGEKALERDARQRLARVQGVLDPRRATVRTKDLQMALNPEMYSSPLT
jgi:DNA-binding TFAR19-related protein (PDSD5 family)